MKIGSFLVLGALLLGVGPAGAEVVRRPCPNSNFPIAQSVEVSGNVTTYYVGPRPGPSARQQRRRSGKPASPGVTKTPRSASSTRSRAYSRGLGSAWATWSRCRYSWSTTHGRRWTSRASWRATRNSSAAISRTCRHAPWVGVAALANPGFLVEIEVVAVKNAK